MKVISITEVMRGVKVVRYLNLLLLALSLLLLALLAREYVVQSTALTYRAQGLAAAGTTGKAKKSSFSDYTVIGGSGILGRSTALNLINSRPVERRQGSGPAKAAAASSQVTLLGTVTGSGGEDFAIFKEKTTGKEEVVRRGGSVFSVGRLVSVSRYRAVVESGGRLQTFVMDVSEKERQMGEKPGPRGRGDLFGPGGLSPFMGRLATGLAKPLGNSKWLVDRRALDNALRDSNKVLDDARFYPYREGGKVKGFLISQVRPSGVFYGMGMRSGDIILRVNDYAIDAPEKAMSLMKGLKGETNVKVDILRRGRAQTFKYEIR